MYVIRLLLEPKSFCSICWLFNSPDDVIIIHVSVCVNNYFKIFLIIAKVGTSNTYFTALLVPYTYY